MSDHDQLKQQIAEGHARVRDATFAFVESDREPRPDWRNAVHDALTELERIVERSTEPDARDWARSAVSCLLGIWLDADESDEVYLGGREP